MKISIITTCYNRKNTIGHTIQSVLSQTYNNIEYIIIDGASSDGSLDIINRYAGQITKIVSEPDNGVYHAINKGIQLATGDVIGLLHSDDVFFDCNTIYNIAEALKNNNADIVYGNGVYVTTKKRKKIIRDWISNDFEKSAIKRGWLPPHPTVYVKQDVFKKCGLYNESYKIASDCDMLIRMLYKNDFSIYYLNQYIVCMLMGGISTSFGSQLLKWKEDIHIYRKHGFNPYYSLFRKITSKIKQYY